MAHIKRKYIDKHWLMFVLRGALAAGFSCYLLFGGSKDIQSAVAIISIFLLFMGIVDAIGALYSSVKKHGWINSIIDALVDVVAAVALLFFAVNDPALVFIILSVYTVVSGIIDIFHGFLSTVDPTDRFIRVVAGVCGAVIGAVILNSATFSEVIFAQFFGAYLLIVGVTSMIYGVHNRAQGIEDKEARKEAVAKAVKTKAAKKATTKKVAAKKTAKKTTKKVATKKR